jgi:type I restriction enzyme, S subunit
MTSASRMRTDGPPWSPSAPSHWDVVPLMTIGRESRVRNAGLVEKNLLSLSYGQIVQKDILANEGLLPESFETYQIVERGDIVFRFTDLQNDTRSLRSGLVSERGIITSAYLAFTPLTVEPRFLAYLMRGYDLLKAFYGMGDGLRQSLKYEDIRRMPILLPPREEQVGIADFLDQETAKIDALLEKQNQLVVGMWERRSAILDHLVLTLPVEAERLRRFADVTVGIVVTPSAWYADEGVIALRGVNVQPESLSLDDVVYLSEEGDALHEKSRLKQGDVVVVRTGQAGAACAVPLCLYGANAIDLLIVRCRAGVLPEYLAAVLNSGPIVEAVKTGSVGAIQGHFNVSSLKDVVVPIPDLPAQGAFLSEWRHKSAQLDALVSRVERALVVARERRSALIAAAVTGQLGVSRGKVA